ncbi:hypothetical protein MASR2M78_37430 [Treponema sp.]
MHKSLVAVLNENPEFLNISALDDEGFVVVSPLLPIGLNLSDRFHVKEALITGKFTPSNYIVSLIEETPSLIYAQPIIDASGKIIGVINAVYSLSSYENIFNRFKLADNSILGLLDRLGQSLYYYPPISAIPLGVHIKPSLWEDILKMDGSRLILETGTDGIERYYAPRALRLDGVSEPYQTSDLESIDLGDYAGRLIALVSTSMPNVSDITTRLELEPILCGIDVAIPFGLLLNELLSNAFKHAFLKTASGTLKGDGAQRRYPDHP